MKGYLAVLLASKRYTKRSRELNKSGNIGGIPTIRTMVYWGRPGILIFMESPPLSKHHLISEVC